MIGNECQGIDCCASPLVKGGTFTQGNGTSSSFQSTVSSFRLDKYEVTVARFRKFVAAYESWHAAGNPENNDGANPNVSGSGWSSTWSLLPTNAAQLKANVSCSSNNRTWLDGAGNDTLPMNCVNWYTSFAFCISGTAGGCLRNRNGSTRQPVAATITSTRGVTYLS